MGNGHGCSRALSPYSISCYMWIYIVPRRGLFTCAMISAFVCVCVSFLRVCLAAG